MSIFFQQLIQDIVLHQCLKHLNQADSHVGRLWTLVSSPGMWFTLSYRIMYYSTNSKNLRSPTWWIARILEVPASFLNTLVCKSDVLGDCCIEGGVYLSDGGYLTCGARHIGSGSIIHDHVTFGFAVGDKASGRPSLGKNVWVGPNSIVAGGVEVGDGATLLPGTFLTFSVPAGTVVRGNPARVVRNEFDNSQLRKSLEIYQDIPKA